MVPPTLHSTQAGLYDNIYSFAVNSAPISSPEEFSNVDEYRESEYLSYLSIIFSLSWNSDLCLL